MRLVVGDVHGCYSELVELLENVIGVTPDDEVLFVGDLVSKGPNSLLVIEYLMTKIQSGFNYKAILGNHEFRILSLFHEDFTEFERYLSYYNCQDLLTGELDQIISFFESLPFYVDLNDWLILHAPLTGEKACGPSDVRALFGEERFHHLLLNLKRGGKRQVYGHLVRSLEDIELDVRDGKPLIGIDGGCVYPDFGHLCALDLDREIVYSVLKGYP